MIGHRGHAGNDDSRTAFMFKRFFDASPESRAQDADLREAERFWARLGEFSVPAELAEQRGARPYNLVIAAFALIMVVGAALWWNMPAPAPWQSFTSPHGSRTIAVLEDGSRISLAAESRVDVRFVRKERELRLVAGQALFEVAHDPDRRFVVRAGKGTVTAVGTSFNIRLAERNTQVTVVKGIVDIGLDNPASPGEPVTVTRAKRGEQVNVSFRRQNGSTVAYFTTRAGVDLAGITSWTRGKLFFDGEPLAEAVSTVNAYSSKKLVLKDPAYAQMPVYGILDQGDVRGLLLLVNNPRALSTEP